MTKRKKPAFRGLVAACLVLVLLGGGMAYQQVGAVASVVSLDVNPSVELRVNQNEKVLRCEALNEEAQTVLADMNGGADLKGAKLDVAVNAIVGALVRSGYLSSMSSAILISVEDGDQARAERLQQELSAAVDGVLGVEQTNAAVLSQTVEKNAALEQQAREHHISTGKAALVNRALALNGALRFDALAALSVEELKDLVETGAPGMPIGLAAAAEAAQNYAGIAEADVLSREMDAELDENPACYEVELRTKWGETEYLVDAYTGEVLRGKPILAAGSGGESEGTGQSPIDSGERPTGGEISREEAKRIALSSAGLMEADVTWVCVEKDEDDGRVEYEVEFKACGMEYEYIIDAGTGAVLEHEKEHHGHHDHHD